MYPCVGCAVAFTDIALYRGVYYSYSWLGTHSTQLCLIYRELNHSMGLCDGIRGTHTRLLTTPAPRSIIARTNVAFVNSSYTCCVCVGWNHNKYTRSRLQPAAMCRELTVHQRESNSQSFDQEPNYTPLHHQPPGSKHVMKANKNLHFKTNAKCMTAVVYHHWIILSIQSVFVL